MSKQGYIKLYRQITDTPVWADSDKLKLWLMCLMKATHDEKTQVVGNQIIDSDIPLWHEIICLISAIVSVYRILI